MEIEVRARHITLNDELRLHVMRRMHFALGRFDHGVRRARVRLEDLNGPKGGVDMRCSLELFVNGQKPCVAQAVDADLFAAIDRATGIAGRMLASALAKKRDRRTAA
jgi:ribosome-associated translation inhibitor RaiA